MLNYSMAEKKHKRNSKDVQLLTNHQDQCNHQSSPAIVDSQVIMCGIELGWYLPFEY